MNNYTIHNPNEFQVINNYFYLLDNKINGCVQYKDIYNPDYIILNQQQASGDQLFYTDNELRNELELISSNTITYTDSVGDSHTAVCTYIHVYKLRAHQGLLNVYGENTFIKYSESDPDIEDEWVNRDQLKHIEQGFVVISNAIMELSSPLSSETLLADQDVLYSFDDYLLESSNVIFDPTVFLRDPNNYLIHSLGSSGTYYIPTGWSPTSTWTYTTNATDLYGSSVYFTAAPNSTRWFCKTSIEKNSLTYHLYDVSEYAAEHILILNSINYSTIVSTRGSIWGIQYILGSEIITDGTENLWEEIICDEKVSTYTQLSEDKQMCNYYSIITNLPDLYYNIYINYY